MKALVTICVLLLAALSITVDQVNADDSVWVLEDIYVGDSSIACGASTLDEYPEIGITKLTRECKYNVPLLSVDMVLTLDFTYPMQLSYENPGIFTAKASLNLKQKNDESNSSASIRLRLEGELWSYSPKCEKEEYESKIFNRGESVNTTFQLEATCDYIADCHPNCDYSHAWWSGEEATFAFEVTGRAGSFSPSFHIWLTYREMDVEDWFVLWTPTTGSGKGRVMSNPGGIDCPPDCSESYHPGTIVNLTASPGPFSRFTGWSGDCTGREPCTVIMNRDVTAVANFEEGYSSTAELYVKVSGMGTVTSDPPGINCRFDTIGGCSHFFDTPGDVILTATPDRNWNFSGWSGVDCPDLGPCTVYLSDLTNEKDISAKFVIEPFLGAVYELLLLYGDPKTGKK